LGLWFKTKPRVPVKKESDELLTIKQKLAAVENGNPYENTLAERMN